MIEYWDPRERPRGPVSRRAILTGEPPGERGTPAAVRADARDLVALYAGRDAAVDAAGADRGRRPDPFARPVRIGRGTAGHTPVASAPVADVIPEPERESEPEVVSAPVVDSDPPETLTAARRFAVRLPRLPRPRAVQRFFAAWLVVAVLLAGTVGSAAAQQRYRVQEGDTLESIAAEFGVDPNAILAASWMANPPYPAPGEVLVIPRPGQSPSEAARMAAEREGTSPWVSGAYTVQPGDSIEYIAGLYGVDPYALAELNGVVEWKTIQIGQRLLIPASAETAPVAADDLGRRGPDSSVWVPRHAQRYNLSCEYAAAFIATSAFGGGVTEEVFLGQVPRAKNPHIGYRGDINGAWGNYDDYGVYPEPLAPVLNEWGFVGEVFYSAGDPTMLINHIDQGHPVITWLAYWGNTGKVYDDDGRYTVFAGAHVVVVYGYDAEGVYVSDPATGRYRFWAWGDFLWMWETMDGMALAVYPM
ncbi:MAG: LysM peptidoglycan-binding domain-containing protein [Thermomicrobiales bacterium]